MTAPGTHILIVEDEADIRRFVRLTLETEGHTVHEAATLQRGLIEAGTRRPDLVVLDLGLPDGDGVDLIRDLRTWSAMPIIVLSARSAEASKIAALDVGADDYLVKPFSFAELLARVRTILRRGRTGMEATTLQVADLELDLLRRRVSRSGKRIDLTAKEFGLLELLMRRHGEVLPRSLIASQVWDVNFDSDTNVIEVAMRRLRLKIDEGQDVKLIQTVRGMGYVLEAPESV